MRGLLMVSDAARLAEREFGMRTSATLVREAEKKRQLQAIRTPAGTRLFLPEHVRRWAAERAAKHRARKSRPQA